VSVSGGLPPLPVHPSAERNKRPIADVLARVLPPTGLVLEIASGTGQHAEHFARTLPHLTWQPTERDDEMLAALAERVRRAALPNLARPLKFDVHGPAPRVDTIAAVVCINMIHIAPWSACAALLEHAERWLAPGAPLVLYGPFKRRGEHTAPSNAAFDAQLRSRDPEWGVRDLDDVVALARERFELAEAVAMPANNLTVVLIRR
jgi:SAM-dependent methyltransferase